MKDALRRLPLIALLATAGCAYDYAGSHAPSYPSGYDSGMGSGRFVQPGDVFAGQDVASIDVFLAPLAQHGQWVDSRYGRAFRPAVGHDWRPYVNGQWGENRLWISHDPWGWATDHYGRWGHDDRIGWVWVPGTEWAPSWTAWREDEAQDVAGWSPVPPGIAYSAGVGFGTGFGGGFGYDNWNSWYAPGWVWVPRGSLYRPGFGGAVLPWSNGYNYWRGSRWHDNSGWSNRPGGWNGGRDRPDNGNRKPRPGISEGIGGAIAGTPSLPRPGDWQGRPRGDRPANTGGPRPRGAVGEMLSGNLADDPGANLAGAPGANLAGAPGANLGGRAAGPRGGNRGAGRSTTALNDLGPSIIQERPSRPASMSRPPDPAPPRPRSEPRQDRAERVQRPFSPQPDTRPD